MRKRNSQIIDQSANLQDFEEEQIMGTQEEEINHHEKNHGKPVLFLTVLSVALGIIFSMFFGSSSTGKAEEVVGNRISQSTRAGEKLFDTEINAGITAKDFSVSMNDSGGSTRMLIWDFNKEDLDQVQILVNGQPVKEQLILTKNPAAISIPVPSVVTITGLKDNGGGISYAVKFPNNRETYFNALPVGGSNTYTVTIKP